MPSSSRQAGREVQRCDQLAQQAPGPEGQSKGDGSILTCAGGRYGGSGRLIRRGFLYGYLAAGRFEKTCAGDSLRSTVDAGGWRTDAQPTIKEAISFWHRVRLSRSSYYAQVRRDHRAEYSGNPYKVTKTDEIFTFDPSHFWWRSIMQT